MGKTEKYEVGTKWNRPHGYNQEFPRIIEAVHYNGNKDDGEDVIVYRGEGGDLGYDRRYSMDGANWTKVEPKWVRGKTYITGPDSGEDKWVCVHVFITGAAGLVHINPESDVLRRVAHADRRFYRELSELRVNHKPDPSDYERGVF